MDFDFRPTCCWLMIHQVVINWYGKHAHPVFQSSILTDGAGLWESIVCRKRKWDLRYLQHDHKTCTIQQKSFNLFTPKVLTLRFFLTTFFLPILIPIIILHFSSLPNMFHHSLWLVNLPPPNVPPSGNKALIFGLIPWASHEFTIHRTITSEAPSQTCCRSLFCPCNLIIDPKVAALPEVFLKTENRLKSRCLPWMYLGLLGWLSINLKHLSIFGPCGKL